MTEYALSRNQLQSVTPYDSSIPKRGQYRTSLLDQPYRTSPIKEIHSLQTTKYVPLQNNYFPTSFDQPIGINTNYLVKTLATPYVNNREGFFSEVAKRSSEIQKLSIGHIDDIFKLK
jgi:hypothetical protein